MESQRFRDDAGSIDPAYGAGAGVPESWLDHGIGVDGLRTPQGGLHYALKREGDALVWKVGDGMEVPPGGIVLT